MPADPPGLDGSRRRRREKKSSSKKSMKSPGTKRITQSKGMPATLVSPTKPFNDNGGHQHRINNEDYIDSALSIVSDEVKHSTERLLHRSNSTASLPDDAVVQGEGQFQDYYVSLSVSDRCYANEGKIDGMNKMRYGYDIHHDYASYGAPKKNILGSCVRSNSSRQENDAAKYGYGDITESAPDSADYNNKYGYEVHTPHDQYDYASYGAPALKNMMVPQGSGRTTRYNSIEPQDDAANPYGYGDINESAPDPYYNKYGYEVHDRQPRQPRRSFSPKNNRRNSSSSSSSIQQLRKKKSAMKNSNGLDGSIHSVGSMDSTSRRSSIGFKGELETQLPCGRVVKRRTSIGFDDNVETYEVAPAVELADDPSELYMQDDEYKRIANGILRKAAKINEGKLDHSDRKRTCTRGLEDYIGHEKGAAELRNRRAVNAVVGEQQRQWTVGSYWNDNEIANNYKKTSISSKLAAKQRAKQDEEEVKAYMKSTRRFCRRMSM